MQNINIKLNPDDVLDISSQVPIKTGTAQQVTNVSDVLTGPQGPAGPQGETGPAGPAGPQGIQGETGATGQSANISIGTVTTLPVGSNATVVNSGSSMDAVLDFGIPQGAKGDTGATGPQGETGPQGPKGDTGDVGPQGPAGASATITVGTVTTLPAGSNATVVNSGTSMDAVLDFGIPKGEAGSSTVTYVSAETAIGKWIDGSTIYRRVVSGTYNSVVGTTNIFTIKGVSKLINGYGHIKNVDCILTFGQNHWVGSTIVNSSFAFIAGGNLIARSYNTLSTNSLPYEIVLEYIK